MYIGLFIGGYRGTACFDDTVKIMHDYNEQNFEFAPLANSGGGSLSDNEQIQMNDLSLRRSSSESETSEIFHDIDEYNVKYAYNMDNFQQNPDFQYVQNSYLGKRPMSKKTLGIIGAIIGSLWFIGLLIYSNGQVTHIAANLTWKTNVTLAYQNVNLNEYDPKFANLTMNHYRKGLYSSYQEPITWLNSKQYPKNGKAGGYYLTLIQKRLTIKQVQTNYNYIFLESTQFKYNDQFFYLSDIKLNPSKPVDDLNNSHIIVTDLVSQWRHLSLAIYWLFNPGKKSYIPIQPKNDRSETGKIDKLDFAEFSPNGDYIVFGTKNDLYIYDVGNQEVDRITENGSKNIYNGKADWVYEEEILGDSKMFWWSPNQESLIFATLNDTQVHDFDLNYYIKHPAEVNDTDDGFNLYPKSTTIKYPKPDTPNPMVILKRFKLEDKSIENLSVDFQDSLLYYAIWTDNDHFLIKTTDRTSRVLTKRVLQPKKSNIFNIVQIINATASYDGWFEKQEPITLIEKKDKVSYIDSVIIDGRNHLALYDDANSGNYSKLVTAGNWDIRSDLSVAYDKRLNFLYAYTTIKSSMDSHLIGVDLNKDVIFNLTNPSIDGFYEGQFSNDGQYLNLHYRGPNVPWQRLVNMGSVHDYLESEDYEIEKSADEVLQSSNSINHVEITSLNLKDTNIPTKSYLQIKIGQFPDKSPINVNVIQILPPNFDPKNKKYPLVVYAYGGPGSQIVDKQFAIDFLMISSSFLNSIVLIIDPRGTGGQDWKFKAFATNNLGYWESRDISTIVSEYMAVNKKFIDKKKTAIWGWSYGGFTTLKTLEYDAGEIFKFGIAVAPVTNWLFYDSVYTERYFSTPSLNRKNYDKNGKIKEYKNFKKVQRFMIMHGTSDDNVHLQNLLWLLDKFNLHTVENYDVQFFPDSDHSIQFHNAQSIVYDKILNWLNDAFTGKFKALY